jgi:hypothetical protein
MGLPDECLGLYKTSKQPWEEHHFCSNQSSVKRISLPGSKTLHSVLSQLHLNILNFFLQVLHF